MKLRGLFTIIALLLVGLIFQNCGKGFRIAELGADTPNTAQNITYGNCPTAGYTATSATLNLKGDCEITGGVTLTGTSTLTMTSGTLTVKGSVLLKDTSQLVIVNGALKFPQTNYSQYSLTLNNNSKLSMKSSIFLTNASNQNNFSMVLDASDSSVVEFENSSLDTNTGNWLLGNFSGNSKLTMTNTDNLPTEIYPSGATTLSISGGSSFASVWLEFASGTTGTVNLPSMDSQGNYNFNFGPTAGINYSVQIASSKGRLGLNSHPSSNLTVNGNGASSTSDVNVVFGYYIENNSSAVTINGLTVGNNVTRQFTDQGRNLQLNHVNLNPFSWQVYVSQSNGYNTTITNSFINEIVMMTNGLATVSSSVLQLAVTAAAGPGSVLNITNNSHIWSQSLLAQNGGKINISNSQLHGNFISASGSGSKITMTNVGDAKNGLASETCTPVNGYPPNNNGVPLCNPFNPLHQCAQLQTPTGGAQITANPNLTCN